MESKRMQSALEYLVSYSWALVIIIVVAVILYSYLSYPKQSTGNFCNFVQGAYCSDVILQSDPATAQVSMAMYMNNAQQYPVANPQVIINVNGTNSTPTSCTPKFVLSGSIMICTMNVPVTLASGSFLSGSAFLVEQNCGLTTNPYNSALCASAPKERFSGNFGGTTQQSVTLTPLIVLTVANSTQSHNISDSLYATVTVLNHPLDGADVNFTTSGAGYTISPQIARTNSSGIALALINATLAGSVTVTANYSGHLSTNTITFT
ncbi:MAG: Ig-like domain-containing protein [Candidatus Micrarchaeota archaeon]|nr:Ig-like domain-containing protein [Candidatus Micrarchaeota archaeon]